MKIKRFFAKDMRLALLQVKEELGSSAVIMSNKKVVGGVEIVAAIDGDPSSASKASQPSLRPTTSRPASSSQASSQQSLASRQSAAPSRHTEHRQAAPSLSSRIKQRELDDDKLSLSGSKARGNSVSKRFANMLKQYAGGRDEYQSQDRESEDSLSSLLERQSKHRNPNEQEEQIPYNPDSPLARLIAQDNRFGKPEPKLDPTRYDRHHSATETVEKSEDLENMREEMTSIRRLLEHQVSGLMWQEVERREPLRAMLIKRLERMGFSAEFADQMACYIPENTQSARAWKALLSLVADQITIPKKDILKRGGVVALLGPTGVGKTTTVAKLAARAAMEYGADNVALVTTDTYRIGAHEQLLIYGRIMGCAVKVAKDSDGLADVLYQLRNKRLILVDTAGMGQRDVRLSEQLDTLMQKKDKLIQSYLVLPATAQRRVLQETIDHFRRVPLSGCILTKLDESLSLGEFISVIVQNAMPLAYIANGQRVPEDIVIAQPKYMLAKANELLEKSTESEPHFWSNDNGGL